MANFELLNNISHKDIKVITKYSADFGDDVATIQTFPTEFGNIQKEYPIFFRKHPTSQEFQAVVMLGFFPNQNLFLDNSNNNWYADYIPAAIKKGPFSIGFQDQSADGGSEQAPVVHIDMDSPKVNEKSGADIFLEHGGNSPYLEKINSILLNIMEGLAMCKAMFHVYTELDLIEPVELEIKLLNNEVHKLHGNYTISKEKLKNLSAENLKNLQDSGFLEGAYLIMSSVSNVQKLVNWQNKQLQRKVEKS